MLPETKQKSIRTMNNLKQKGDWFMFVPFSPFRRAWGILTIIALIYTATIMPYNIALIDDSNFSMYVIDTFFDFVFMTDILV